MKHQETDQEKPGQGLPGPAGHPDDGDPNLRITRNMVLKISPDGKLLYSNGGSKEILGYEPGEGVGKSIRYFLTRPSYATARRAFKQASAVQSPESLSVELDFIHKNGRPVCCELTLLPEYGPQGHLAHIRCIIKDISYLKFSEHQLKLKKHMLDDFVYMVSHEIKNPLKILKGYLENIDGDISLYDKYNTRLHHQADYLLKLVDKLLAFSGIGKDLGPKTRIKTVSLLKGLYSTLCPGNVPGELVMDGVIPDIWGEPFGTQQIFSNLIENSIKFRDPAKEKHRMTVKAFRHKGTVTIVLQDNGMGMTPLVLEKAFQPGFTRDTNGGTGFGLAIVKKLMEAHGGSVTARSDGQGMGAVFYLSFPDSVQ